MLINQMPVMVPIPIASDPTSWWKGVWDWRKNKRRFLLVEPWEYTLPVRDGKPAVTIIIPKGFIFDGASIPRILWPILYPFGILMLAGLCHDFGYRYDFMLTYGSDYEAAYVPVLVNAGRRVWDDVFYDVARDTNGIILMNKLAYYLLRAFAYFPWRKRRKENAPVYWRQDDRNLEEIWDELVQSAVPDSYLTAGYPRESYVLHYA